MICIPDKPVSMTEWTHIRRVDVESVFAIRSSPEEESIIEKSLELHEQNAEKPEKPQPVHGKNVKGSRIRRHSSYEPSLDDIKEEGYHDSCVEVEERDLAAVHRERAFNSKSFKQNRSEGRHFRKKQFEKLSMFSRPRSLTC